MLDIGFKGPRPVLIDPHPLPPTVLEAIAVPVTFFTPFVFFSAAFLCIPCWRVVIELSGLGLKDGCCKKMCSLRFKMLCIVHPLHLSSCTRSALHAIGHLMHSALTTDLFRLFCILEPKRTRIRCRFGCELCNCNMHAV